MERTVVSTASTGGAMLQLDICFYVFQGVGYRYFHGACYAAGEAYFCQGLLRLSHGCTGGGYLSKWCTDVAATVSARSDAARSDVI